MASGCGCLSEDICDTVRGITDAAGHSGIPCLDDAVLSLRRERDELLAERDRLEAALTRIATLGAPGEWAGSYASSALAPLDREDEG